VPGWVEVVVLAPILGAGLYVIGYIIYFWIASSRAGRRDSARAREKEARALAQLSSDEIRQRLLHDSYLSQFLKDDVMVQGLLARVSRGDEVSLAQEYPDKRLYPVLARAENAAGYRGRPLAMDESPRISALLAELARRTASEKGGPTTG
jgi:hypothetical protein